MGTRNTCADIDGFEPSGIPTQRERTTRWL